MPLGPNTDRYRVAVEAAPCGAVLVDPAGIIRLANAQLAEMFETDLETLLGASVDMLLPEAKRRGHAQLRQGFLAEPSVRPMGSGRDLWGRTARGRRIPIEVSLRPVDGFILCSVVDITARRREQERFRIALDAAPNSILMVDADGVITLCNRHTERVFGYARDELLGQPIEALLPAEAVERHRRDRRRYLENPTPREMGVGRELLAVRKDGSKFPVEVALQPVDMDQGKFVIASVVDISVRVDTQQVIEAQFAELEERNRELRALARSTSHDLKGPLSTIVGLASGMLDDLAAGHTDELPRAAEWTRELALRTASSLERLREVADATLNRHQRSVFELATCVEDVMTELAPLRSVAGVEFRFDAPEGLSLESERPRVTAILRNLLANAVDYHDAQKQPRWAEIRAESVGNTVRILVRDNGIGIPADMRERVFGLFERAHASDSPGSGIGLALVHRHVRQLGGTVRLLPDEVTTFELELPGAIP